MSETTTLVPSGEPTLLAAPLPTFSGAEMARALAAYKDLQRALDAAMPDQIQHIPTRDGERDFRKKGFWRAVAVAFNLDVELVSETRDDEGVTADGEADWGYVVTYRARAKTGRSITGDGACYASEKYETQRTIHNVRSHAHTRAKNRAISDLVGFGEVSAEEVERDTEGTSRPPTPASRRPAPSSRGTTPISEKQVTRFWAIANQYGWPREGVDALLAQYGFEHADAITRDRYESLCAALEKTGGAS